MTRAQLDTAEVEEAQLRRTQVASEEADAARREWMSRRKLVEADRRQAEATRMTSLQDAISRRPGGRKVLLAAQRSTKRELAARRDRELAGGVHTREVDVEC